MSASLARLLPKRLVFLIACTAAGLALPTTGVAGAASALPTLTLTATNTSITVGGTPVAGAVNVISTSTGKLKEPAVILFKFLPGANQAEVFAKTVQKNLDPNSLDKYGSIVFDAEAPEGKGTEAQTLLEPGEYAAVLVGEHGPANVHATFTVAASPAPLALPAPSAKIKSIDFGFRGPTKIKTGSIVGFEDGGFLVHMDIAFPARSLKAAKAIVAGLKSGHEKGLEKLVAGPPITFQGPVSPGGYQQETITAKPGWYVQVCFMETQDKRVHTRLGMERIFKITK
jgi:hypothetical protein